MLDVNRLRVIDAVARHGSVTAAAKELHYSQPSVTHHLARLEIETGAQLLQRVDRGIRLNAARQLLAELAARASGEVRNVEASLLRGPYFQPGTPAAWATHFCKSGACA